MSNEKADKAIYLISISSLKGPQGAVFCEFKDTPDIQAIRIDPEGPDSKMELNRSYTTEEMRELGY